jgi:hypothetical protein
MAWAIIAIVSTFIQCSYFNYYQLAYLDRYGIDRLLSKQDERSRDDLNIERYSLIGKVFLRLLRFLYAIIYSWQDHLIAVFDRRLIAISGCRDLSKWYGDKIMMVAQSALCFGTHIFILIVFTIIRKPEWGLIFIGTIMNFYLFYLISHRAKRFSESCSDV